MDRCAEHKGIGGLGLSMASLTTPPNTQPLPAAQPPQPMQPPTGFVPTFRISVSMPLAFSSPGDQGQGGIGAALLVGAAVDEQDFHKQILSFFGKTRRTRGALP